MTSTNEDVAIQSIPVCMSAYYRLPPADQASDHTQTDVTVSSLLPE